MTDVEDWYKKLMTRTYEYDFAWNDTDDIIDDVFLATNSQYKSRLLGITKTGKRLEITEESRPHIHIIGTTQEGKSKFIERLVRGDIKRGIGFCLLDPTTGGETVYSVLKYCCEKKIEKVCLIDPYHRFEAPYYTVPKLSPFLYTADGIKSDKLREVSISDTLDTVRILFNVKDPSEQPRIERYLPAVLNVLYDSQSSLRDARYFSNQDHIEARKERLIWGDPDSQADLKEAFSNHTAYFNFQSTINRMQRFFKGTMGMMFAPNRGINFMKLVSEGWIILVNLDTGLGFDKLDSRLLGTFIINQIQTSIERLNRKIKEKNPDARPKPYYLYIDEASRYANEKLADTLSLKQKTGLKVTLAHQYTDQFPDKTVLNSVLANCKVTVMFNVRMTKDRDLISEQFYGGDINPKDASFANADLPKQEAVIKAIKGSPIRVQIPTVRKPLVTHEQLRQYILDIYANKDFYQGARELKEKLEPAYVNPPSQPPSPKDSRVSKRNPKADYQTDNQTVKGQSAFSRAKPTGSK